MKSIADAGTKAKLMFESSNADGWISGSTQAFPTSQNGNGKS